MSETIAEAPRPEPPAGFPDAWMVRYWVWSPKDWNNPGLQWEWQDASMTYGTEVEAAASAKVVEEGWGATGNYRNVRIVRIPGEQP